jgi:regulator of nonsense transcripts 1
VRACLSRRLALIQGPPGTGKTATTAAALYHLVRQGSGSVLAVAASNTAATRLATVAQQLDLRVLRHLSRAREADAASMHEHLTLQHHAAAVDSRSAAALDKLLQLKREFDPLAKGDEELLQDLRADVEIHAMRSADVVVCTLLAAGDIAIARHTFKVVIIDEAAQADEPSTLVPLTLGCERLIAVGDQNQLGPVVAHQPSQRAGYGVSMFQGLASGLVSPCLLNRQYRMHPWLAQYPSDAFYEGRLVNGVTVAARAHQRDVAARTAAVRALRA